MFLVISAFSRVRCGWASVPGLIVSSFGGRCGWCPGESQALHVAGAATLAALGTGGWALSRAFVSLATFATDPRRRASVV